ncbi:MAG: transglutaminase family protein [Alphaproteobacteria bacterium]|nr:transglutaminase family protein [Alphaproteobacteria bacterium]
MRFEVQYATRFRFDATCGYSIHQCRLRPRLGESQRLLSWEVRTPGRGRDWIDGYGNHVRTFSLTEAHREIELVARGVFEWIEGGEDYLVFAAPEALPPGYWLRNHGLARHEASIAAFVADLRDRAEDETERVPLLHTLMRRLVERVEYRVGATAVDATAAEALARGAGVCQDFAHIFIACSRALGVPARYASGCLSRSGSSHVGSVGHGWAEAFVPDLGWIGFDAANGICATGEYLKLGIGLDYAEAAPVTGRRIGGGEAAMAVDVQARQVG